MSLTLSLASASFAGNTKVYQGLEMQIPFVTGVYQLAVGPINVNPYSQIRVTTWGNSGSGTISVSIVMTDSKGNLLGQLDTITLDFSSAATTTASKVYSVPGQYLKFYFQSLNPDYVSLVVHGR